MKPNRNYIGYVKGRDGAFYAHYLKCNNVGWYVVLDDGRKTRMGGDSSFLDYWAVPDAEAPAELVAAVGQKIMFARQKEEKYRRASEAIQEAARALTGSGRIERGTTHTTTDGLQVYVYRIYLAAVNAQAGTISLKLEMRCQSAQDDAVFIDITPDEAWFRQTFPDDASDFYERVDIYRSGGRRVSSQNVSYGYGVVLRHEYYLMPDGSTKEMTTSIGRD